MTMQADRKQYTFEHWYKPMYLGNQSIIAALFDFENMIKESDGYKISLRKDLKDLVETQFDATKREKIKTLIQSNEALVKEFPNSPIRLSGDADYELKDDKGQKIEKMHYLPNFSLMPVTGNWNIAKGTRPLKKFLNENIGKYYDNQELQNIPYRKWNRYSDRKEELEKKAMKAFLDLFDSIDEYCMNCYFLSMDDIQQLDEREYWDRRIEIAKGKNIKEEEMKKDISADNFK